MNVEVNYGGLIPSFGYVGNHGLNGAAKFGACCFFMCSSKI